jgi:hypothetical protein
MVFVNQRDFVVLPCYRLDLRRKEVVSDFAPALTDAIEVITGRVEINNPRWEHTNLDKKEASPDKAAFGDKVLLMADIKNYPNGAPMTFDIFDISENPPLRIATAQGENEQGVGKGEWVVTDNSGKGEEQKLAFEAIARSKATEKKEIPLISEFGIRLLHFEDKEGNKIEITAPHQTVFLIVETTGMIGKKVDIDLSDADFDYEYNGTAVENDLLRDLEISADRMKIEMKSISGRK